MDLVAGCELIVSVDRNDVADKCTHGLRGSSSGNPCPGDDGGTTGSVTDCDDSCNEAMMDCTEFDITGSSCDEDMSGPPLGTCDVAGVCSG